mgnify:CR=1 FL=1
MVLCQLPALHCWGPEHDFGCPGLANWSLHLPQLQQHCWADHWHASSPCPAGCLWFAPDGHQLTTAGACRCADSQTDLYTAVAFQLSVAFMRTRLRCLWHPEHRHVSSQHDEQRVPAVAADAFTADAGTACSRTPDRATGCRRAGWSGYQSSRHAACHSAAGIMAVAPHPGAFAVTAVTADCTPSATEQASHLRRNTSAHGQTD